MNIKRVEGIDKSDAYSEEPMTMDGCAWGEEVASWHTRREEGFLRFE